MAGAGPAEPFGVALRRPGADLCGVDDLSDVEIADLLRRALAIADLPHRADPLRGILRGLHVLGAFAEPSTRTRMSFEVAACRLGADFSAFDGGPSTSATKGETALDALRNLDAMGFAAIIVRAREDGWPQRLTGALTARVINAGDGKTEHPTQALLDAATILEACGRAPTLGPEALAGVRVAICGDIRHSRVAGSNLRLLPRLGASVVVAGPAGLVDARSLPEGVEVADSLDAAIAGADAIMMLRIQRERLPAALEIPDDASYHARWGLTEARLARAAADAVVLHPGPMNRGVEIADAVADGPRSRILRQVRLGVAVRMAVLARACGRLDLLPGGLG
ncbi:MAG: aspartate carbamoyltransferase catalytic subunit [Myxococcales bacterium]|nr:aspartate carbamoyltransferase catalytic subunit [Myxococcales bacterium]